MYALLALALAVPGAGLSLEISAPVTDVLIGEPIKLIVTWKADRALREVRVENEHLTMRSLLLAIGEEGAGPLLYRERPRNTEETLLPRPFSRGDELQMNLAFVRGTREPWTGFEFNDFVFAKAGSYALQVIYAPDWRPTSIASNTLRFRVREPEGDDKVLLEEMRRDPWLLTLDGDRHSQARAQELLSKHAGSPYLRWSRLRALERRKGDLLDRLNPDTREPLFDLDPESLDNFRATQYRRMALELLEPGAWGAFEEEALGQAMAYGRGARDDAIVSRARDDLLARHPESALAKAVLADEAEDEAAPR